MTTASVIGDLFLDGGLGMRLPTIFPAVPTNLARSRYWSSVSMRSGAVGLAPTPLNGRSNHPFAPWRNGGGKEP